MLSRRAGLSASAGLLVEIGLFTKLARPAHLPFHLKLV